MRHFFYIILTFLFLHSNYQSFGQKSVGISIGGSINRLFDYQDNDFYENGYLYKLGFNGSFLYETKTDSTTQFRTELQYSFSELKLDVRSFSSSSSFLNNSVYKSSQIRLNLDYLFRLNNTNKKNKFYFLFGMSLGSVIKTSVVGSGYYDGYVIVEDSSGNQTSVLRSIRWEKSESNNKDFAILIFGISTGIELSFPLKNNLELFIQNKYLFVLTDVLKINTAYTSIFSTYLNLGMKFNL